MERFAIPDQAVEDLQIAHAIRTGRVKGNSIGEVAHLIGEAEMLESHASDLILTSVKLQLGQCLTREF